MKPSRLIQWALCVVVIWYFLQGNFYAPDASLQAIQDLENALFALGALILIILVNQSR